MKLLTDFEDYYDKTFKSHIGNFEFSRMLSNNPDKFNALQFLKQIGYRTIEIGPLSNILGNPEILVYTNPSLHYGAGKAVMPLSSAKMMYSNKPCTEYFKTNMTYKILQIGNECYSLEIENIGFMENKLINCSLLGLGSPGCYNNKYPMYSIDFVRDNNGNMLACDFDCTVKLGHIQGIEQVITAEKIAENLYNYLNNRQEV